MSELTISFVSSFIHLFMKQILESKSFEKLEAAVKGKNGRNFDDLPHLDQFIHTGR